jgi:hypothetical protein
MVTPGFTKCGTYIAQHAVCDLNQCTNGDEILKAIEDHKGALGVQISKQLT